MVHEILSGAISPQSVTPCKVVVENGKLYSLSNRRLAALKMAQSLTPRVLTVKSDPSARLLTLTFDTNCLRMLEIRVIR